MRLLLLATLASLSLAACTDEDPSVEPVHAPIIINPDRTFDPGTDPELPDPCACVSSTGVADEACLAHALSDLGSGLCVLLRCELPDGNIWYRDVCVPPDDH